MWPDRDAAWADVTASLRRVLDAMQGIDRDGVRRSLGHGAPLLRCDRGNQWDEVKRLLRRDGHDLILLTGEAAWSRSRSACACSARRSASTSTSRAWRSAG
jgi:hypothetical protein